MFNHCRLHGRSFSVYVCGLSCDDCLFNIAEMQITPEQFAELLCDDLDLNPIMFVPAISTAIKQQVEQYPQQSIIADNSDTRIVVKVRLFFLMYCAGLIFPVVLHENHVTNCYSLNVCNI